MLKRKKNMKESLSFQKRDLIKLLTNVRRACNEYEIPVNGSVLRSNNNEVGVGRKELIKRSGFSYEMENFEVIAILIRYGVIMNVGTRKNNVAYIYTGINTTIEDYKNHKGVKGETSKPYPYDILLSDLNACSRRQHPKSKDLKNLLIMLNRVDRTNLEELLNDFGMDKVRTLSQIMRHYGVVFKDNRGFYKSRPLKSLETNFIFDLLDENTLDSITNKIRTNAMPQTPKAKRRKPHSVTEDETLFYTQIKAMVEITGIKLYGLEGYERRLEKGVFLRYMRLLQTSYVFENYKTFGLSPQLFNLEPITWNVDEVKSIFNMLGRKPPKYLDKPKRNEVIYQTHIPYEDEGDVLLTKSPDDNHINCVEDEVSEIPQQEVVEKNNENISKKVWWFQKFYIFLQKLFQVK